MKPHLISAVRDPILAFGMIGSHRHDSPVFSELFRGRIPNGHGIVAPDAAYLSEKNCDTIAASGRVVPVIIMPKRNGARGTFLQGERMLE